MSCKKRLGRYKQCAKCPWKKSTDPLQIPNQYSVDKHKALSKTIADADRPLLLNHRAMACHESYNQAPYECVGWLANQLGPGNNIALRLHMLDYDLRDLELVGEQHDCFEDTLPNGV